MGNELVERAYQDRCGANPEDTSPKRYGCLVVNEQIAHVSGAVVVPEIVGHDQYDVHIIWLRFGGNVASKNDEPFKLTRTLGKIMNP